MPTCDGLPTSATSSGAHLPKILRYGYLYLVTTETSADAVSTSAVPETDLTRTEQVVRGRQREPESGSKLRHWWKRRPIRKALVVTHRWPALILGLFLVVETTSGSVLLYEADIFKVAHSQMYHHTSSASPISAVDAISVVNKADPKFAGSWVNIKGGVYFVGNSAYTKMYSVDPGTGHVNGSINRDRGVMGFIVNLHDCAMSCEGYTGYVSWLGADVPTGGITFLNEITWGALILGALGLLLIMLAVTGLITWWPGRKRISHGFRVRMGKGRFARDYDLHNVIGIVAVPFLLMWGITGAAFDFRVVAKAWLAVTGGSQPDPTRYDFTPADAAKGAKKITVGEAISTAKQQVKGDVVWIALPTDDTPYYDVEFVSGYASYKYGSVYPSDAYVYVNPYDATDLKVIDSGAHSPAANRFYDKILEPTHFGWNVNGWWRIIWAVLGMTPLLLMITGISTWLYRRGTKKRRAETAKARAAAKTDKVSTTAAPTPTGLALPVDPAP
jgi:uncharacterized iron-regulated membrane protein